MYAAPAAPAPREPEAPKLRVLESNVEAEEPTEWIGRLRTLANRNPRIAALVLAGVAVVTAVVFFATRQMPAMSIASLKQRAPELDGQTVTVRGRIGEVYQMGNSYAYLLHQGRDTVVVYTRTSHPIPGDKAFVSGSVSTGFLDGAPRVAIFQKGTQQP
jgi:hypothetical protein